jgi:aspartyl aminopeptidase
MNDFIDTSPTVYHVANNIADKLGNNGFLKLDEKDKWDLEKGCSYYIQRNNSAIIAFKIGSNYKFENGCCIIGTHTDSPALKVKNNALDSNYGITKIGVEVYGSPIISSWLDRDLSIAGKIIIKNDKGISEQLIDFKKPIAVIPNLAIHLNREVNKGFEYNKQKHLCPLSSLFEEKDLFQVILEYFDINGEILEADLFFYDIQKSCYLGLNQEFISAPKIDNLAMCHASLESIISSKNENKILISVFYDNEEIGSNTYQGASSQFLKNILERIAFTLSSQKEDYFRMLASSIFISADGAHAVHPNFSEKHDKDYMPIINDGPVIKYNANFRYATTSETAAFFINLCKNIGIDYQKVINRSDIPSGSTIGPMSSALLNVKTIDVGNPMLAMHSIREFAGVKDHFDMIKVLKEFFKN